MNGQMPDWPVIPDKNGRLPPGAISRTERSPASGSD